MKHLSDIKAKKKKEKLYSELWIQLSVKEIQILYYLIEIYHLWIEWKLKWVKSINNEYIHIYHIVSLIENHYPKIKLLRSGNYFTIKKHCDNWLLERSMPDMKTSYIKPTELAYKYIRTYES